ncbi:MAG: N-acetylmuramidase family protein [Pseudomonadota bacterium]
MSEEKLKLWLDLAKWVLGTFLLGAVATYVSYQEKQKSLELAEIKQKHEIEIAEIEQQRLFLNSFLEHALSKDILARIRLAHYVKETTTNEKIKISWSKFYDQLLGECRKQYQNAYQVKQAEKVESLADQSDCIVGGLERLPTGSNQIGDVSFMIDQVPHEGPQPVTKEDLEQVADSLGLEVETFAAFVEVEGEKSGFIEDGRPRIVFERHIFNRLTAGRYAERYPEISSAKAGGYRGGKEEYARLSVASSLATEEALKATSWGMFGFLGVNHSRLGYSNVTEFVEAQFLSGRSQLQVLSKWILSDQKLLNALKERDWKTVVRIYNGPGANKYDEKLSSAYKTLDNAKTAK